MDRGNDETMESALRRAMAGKQAHACAAQHAVNQAGAAADDLTNKAADIRKREAAEAAELLADVIKRKREAKQLVQSAPSARRRRAGAPKKYPRAMEKALRLLAEGKDKDITIYRKCKEEYGAEERIPDQPESFIRAVRREAAKRRPQAY